MPNLSATENIELLKNGGFSDGEKVTVEEILSQLNIGLLTVAAAVTHLTDENEQMKLRLDEMSKGNAGASAEIKHAVSPTAEIRHNMVNGKKV